MSSFDIIKENIEIYRKGDKAKKKIVEEINNILSLNKEYAEFFGTNKLDAYEDIVEVELDEETDKIIITEEYPVWGGETENDYHYFPVNLISDENELIIAIQKKKDEEERKRIAEEEAKRQREIENEKKKKDKEYKEYLRLKEKFKGVY